MRLKPLAATTFALALGVAAGWALGRFTAPTKPGAILPPVPGTSVTAVSPSPTTTPAASVPSSSGDPARDLAAIAAIRDTVERDDAARRLASVADLGAVGPLTDLAVRLLAGDTQTAFLDRLYRRLAAERPLEAFTLVDRLVGSDLEWSLRAAILDTWVTRDVAAAVRWFEGLPPGLTRQRATGPLATALGLHATAEGLALAKRLPQSRANDDLFTDFLLGWAQRDPAAAARAGLDLASKPGRNSHAGHAHILGNLVARWAQRNPDEAIRFLQALPAGKGTREAWDSAVVNLAMSHPTVASRIALLADDAGQRVELVETVARFWTEVDPAAAVAWAERLVDPRQRSSALAVALPRLAETDPAQALALAGRHRFGDGKEVIYHALGSAMTDRPADILKWIDGLPGNAARNAALSGFLEKQAEANPAAAAAFATQLPPGQQRTSAISTVATALAESNPAAALDWFRKLDSTRDKSGAAQSMVWEFSRTNPSLGLDLLEAMPQGPVRDQLHGILVSGWAENDLDGAVRWVRDVPEGPGRDEALLAVADAWAAKDPSAAAKFFGSLDPKGSTPTLLASVAAEWAASDPHAAAAWARELGSAPDSDALDSVLRRWATDSPDEAFRFASQIEDESARNAGLLAALGSVAEQDPRDAARRIEQLADPELRPKAAAAVVGTWAASDPVGAAGWLVGQPESMRPDEVVSALATSLAEYDPRKALEWATTLRDEQLRRSDTARLAREWLRQFPAEADAWLKDAGLDPAFVDEIRRAP